MDTTNKPTRRLFLGSAVGLAGLALALRSANAQTVDAIKSAGVLKVGSQVAQVPWGFTDSGGQLTGFDIELSRMLAKDLGVRAEFTPVTTSNRVAALLTGQVDILAAVMGIFPDRQKVVLFSRPYTNNDTVYIGRADLKVHDFGEMKGLRVGVPRGTPQDIAITKAAPSGVTIQRFDDDATTVQALISGQVDVVGAASTQLANIDKVAGPGKFNQKFVVARAFNAFAVRPQSRELVNSINDFVARQIASGELAALHEKWVGGEFPELPTTGEGDAPLPRAMTN